jgi:hypothetical protein
MPGAQFDDADLPEANASAERQEPDVAEELRRLTNLYRFGVLTDAEFLREKIKLLGSG